MNPIFDTLNDRQCEAVKHTEGPLLTQLQELTRGMAKVAVSEPFYAAF